MLSTTPVMVLDHAAPVAKPKVDASPTCPDVDRSKPSLISPPNSGPMTFLRSEGLAWDRFKQALTNKDVVICYDMFVKEFERSTIHELFKVLQTCLTDKDVVIYFVFSHPYS